MILPQMILPISILFFFFNNLRSLCLCARILLVADVRPILQQHARAGLGTAVTKLSLEADLFKVSEESTLIPKLM
jgi:hypothetical protein